MKAFLTKVLLFGLILAMQYSLLLLLPVTPKASRSLLFAAKQKDFLMENTHSPRIIFIGGSNVSFGLNSTEFKKNLNLNPINTGLHASIGLLYMMDNAKKFVKQGDTVVLIPEYEHFFGQLAYGEKELLQMILEVKPNDIRSLRFRQIFNIIKFIPKYALSKIDITEYENSHGNKDDVYGRNSFNTFGDACAHWTLKKYDFKPFDKISGKFNYNTVQEIKNFETEILHKKAFLYISYPCLQTTSFKNSAAEIKSVETELARFGLSILGTPEKYMMPDSMMFDTPYHLNKDGADFRTALLIKDLAMAQKSSQTQPRQKQ